MKNISDSSNLLQGDTVYQIFLDELRDPVIILEEDFNIAYTNKALQRLLGYSAEGLKGIPFFQIMPTDEAAEIGLKLDASVKNIHAMVEFRHSMLKADGSRAVFESYAVAGLCTNNKMSTMLHLQNLAELKQVNAPDQAEEIYKEIVLGAPDPIFIQIEDKFVYLNPAACVFFGIESPRELIGTPVINRVHQADREIVRERIRRRKIDPSSVPELFEHRFVRKDGCELWAETKGEPIVYEGRQGTVVFLRDTSQRKAAESALKKSEDKYEFLFNKSTLPLLLEHLPDHKILEVNDAWVTLFGYEKAEAIGKTAIELGIIDDYLSDETILESLRTHEVARNLELRHKTKTNMELIVLSNICILEYDGVRFALISNLDITEHKRVEEALFEISERYQKSFDYSAVSMCLVGRDGILINVNKKMCEIFGYEREELEGKHVSEITYSDDVAMSNEAVRQMIVGETTAVTFEKRYVRSSGEIFWCSITSAVLRDMHNNFVHIITQIQDITERRTMLEALHAKDRFNRAVMDNLPIGIAVNTVVPPLKFEYMNDNFPLFYRTTRDAIREIDSFFDTVYEDPAFRESMKEHILGDCVSGDPSRMHWENIPIARKGHETRYVSARNALVPGSDIQISMVIDETERVATLEALKSNAARLQHQHEFDQTAVKGFESAEKLGEAAVCYISGVLGARDVGIGVINLDARVMKVVRLAESDRVGYVISDVLLSDSDFDALETLQSDNAYSFEALPKQALASVIDKLFHLKGYTGGVIMPLFAAEGLNGLVYVGSYDSFAEDDLDVLQRAGLQIALAIEQRRLLVLNERYATGLEQMICERTAQLEAANKELEAFSYSVSHDLRAPLRALSGFVRILLEDYDSVLDDEGKRVCTIISGSARQMGELIDDLLALSRLSRTAMALMKVDMRPLVEGLYNELTTEVQRAAIGFSIGYLPDAPADFTLIRQVWMNLLDNAIKFSSKKTDIRIHVAGEIIGNDVIYSVSDNGAGFNMKYEDKLFGVFQRLHTVKEFEGTGVGLAIVQRIVHRHGGKVWATGEENTGANFHFSLKKEHADG